SAAKSQGVELSVDSAPVSGLTLSAWIAVNDAELTQGFPPGAVLAGPFGVAGNRLPYSARFSGDFSVNYEFPLATELSGAIGGSVSYVGGREDVFTACAAPSAAGSCGVPPPRQSLPAYAKADL